MAKQSKSNPKSSPEDFQENLPRCIALLERDFRSGLDIARASQAVAFDIASRSVTASQGNAICASIRNVVKVVELTHKFGQSSKPNGDKVLLLSNG